MPPGCSIEAFEPTQSEIDGHHGADAQKAFDMREAVPSVYMRSSGL
jgi:hypothetical protein